MGLTQHHLQVAPTAELLQHRERRAVLIVPTCPRIAQAVPMEVAQAGPPSLLRAMELAPVTGRSRRQRPDTSGSDRPTTEDQGGTSKVRCTLTPVAQPRLVDGRERPQAANESAPKPSSKPLETAVRTAAK
jgi:hypothetical protein